MGMLGEGFSCCFCPGTPAQVGLRAVKVIASSQCPTAAGLEAVARPSEAASHILAEVGPRSGRGRAEVGPKSGTPQVLERLLLLFPPVKK